MRKSASRRFVRIVRELEVRAAEAPRGDRRVPIEAAAERFDAGRVPVEGGHRPRLRERGRDRQPDVAETDHRDPAAVAGLPIRRSPRFRFHTA